MDIKPKHFPNVNENYGTVSIFTLVVDLAFSLF